MKFTGSMVALVTPLKNGVPDLGKVRELTAWHAQSGTRAVVPCGTTGEGATLTDAERVAVIAACRGHGIPVIAGVGTNATRTTIENARQAAEAGADALLVVTPYYNKPTSAGMRAHYEAVAAATKLPIILYNVPGRTSVNLAPEDVAALAKVPTIVAIKEASGSLEQVSRIRALTELPVISGDDGLTWPILQMGGVGLISVAANIIPRPMAELCAGSAPIHAKFHKLFKTLFIESSPAPVKAAMMHMKLIDSDELRLPLAPITDASRKILVDVLREYSLM